MDWTFIWLSRISRVLINDNHIFGRVIEPCVSGFKPVSGCWRSGADYSTVATAWLLHLPLKAVAMDTGWETGHWTRWTSSLIQYGNAYVPIYHSLQLPTWELWSKSLSRDKASQTSSLLQSSLPQYARGGRMWGGAHLLFTNSQLVYGSLRGQSQLAS